MCDVKKDHFSFYAIKIMQRPFSRPEYFITAPVFETLLAYLARIWPAACVVTHMHGESTLNHWNEDPRSWFVVTTRGYVMQLIRIRSRWEENFNESFSILDHAWSMRSSIDWWQGLILCVSLFSLGGKMI